MKRILTIIIMTLMMVPASVMAQAGDQDLKLRKGSSLPNFDYTYISPLMLKNMSDRPESQNKLMKGLPSFPLKKTRHIEILKTDVRGTHSDFKSLINNLASEPNFKMVGYNRNGDKGVKICIDTSSDLSDPQGTEPVKRVLVIVWEGFGHKHTVIYLVGNYVLSDLSEILKL